MTNDHPFIKYIFKTEKYKKSLQYYYIKNQRLGCTVTLIRFITPICSFKVVLKPSYISSKKTSYITQLPYSSFTLYQLIQNISCASIQNFFGYLHCKIDKHTSLNTFIWPGRGGRP